MKALTLTQPWATLVAIDAKRIETRSWMTPYRGPLLIHAAKGFPDEAQDVCADEPFRSCLKASGVYSLAHLPLGSIVAVCTLLDCVRVTPRWLSSYTLTQQERAFGNYELGRFAWLLGDVRPLTKPVSCRGALSLWTLDSETRAAVNAALNMEVSHA